MPALRRHFVRSTIARLAFSFLVLVAIVVMTIWLGERAQALFSDVVAARDARSSAVELRNAVLAAESSARGYLFTSNEIYLSPYDRSKAMARRQLKVVLDNYAPYEEQARALERLSTVIAERFEEMDKGVQLTRERKREEALALVRTNRGKALMDEANVFFSGLIRAADERLTAGVAAQGENANWLRWFSIAAGLVVIVLVASAAWETAHHTTALAQARDDLAQLNAGLEVRVAERTTDLEQARDRAELLLAEVNHRVANSLSLVASLVSLQSKAVKDTRAQEALAETQARISAIALLHKRLYSSGAVGTVALDEYLAGLVEQLTTTVKGRGGLRLVHDIAPVHLSTDTSVNLGVVVTEWVTNAIKYAYPAGRGEIRVRLRQTADELLELVVEDDGVGRDAAAPAQGTGLGTRVVNAMAASMNARIEYVSRNPGTAARLVLARTG